MSPTDKAAYFSHGDMETVWKELEEKQTNNRRILGGQNHVVYVRIVKPGSPPIVHTAGADVWVVEAGSAVAVTGGKLVDPKPAADKDPGSIFGDTRGTAIEGGTEQLMTAGDILFVPPGVPHNFEKMKDFRAYLIRFDVK
jgi:mannose-6-phosphate isomerase-like protein (cupin superfamily)